MKETIVFTQNGAVRGVSRRGVNVWRGIPYAAAPVGGLRLRHAQPREPWAGVLDTTRYGPACPQGGSGAGTDEDCLTLNIWAPEGASGKKAVLFYIHGGSFCRGTGNESRYEGTRLCGKNDVVVVTINYRLGALGFLDFSFLGEGFQANCGLSDIVQALKWTYENIAAFGGDPERITAIGQSAGANALAALMTMPSAKPYISGAIMMSGSPVWMHRQNDARQIARDFMEYMGIQTPGELMELPAWQLTERQNKFTKQHRLGESTFSVVVDGGYVPDYPIPAAERGAAAGIPLLVGTTRDEMSFCCKKLLRGVMAVKDFAMEVFSGEKKDLRRRLLACYKKSGQRSQSQLVTDQIFRMSSVWFAQASARHTATWAYSFDYETLLLRLTNLGACHSSDIPYLFGNYGSLRCAYMFLLSPVQRMIRRIAAEMQRDFAQFAKTGSLHWKQCTQSGVPAKCYNRKSEVLSMVDPEIKKEYDRSRFKKRCYQSVYVTG